MMTQMKESNLNRLQTTYPNDMTPTRSPHAFQRQSSFTRVFLQDSTSTNTAHRCWPLTWLRWGVLCLAMLVVGRSVQAQPVPVAESAVKKRYFPGTKVPIPNEPASERRQRQRRPGPRFVMPVRALHTPPFEAPERQRLAITVRLRGDWKVRSLRLHYRSVGRRRFKVARFGRDRRTWYVAMIPARRVKVPGVEYYIEATDLKGRVVSHFASAASPHRVVVRMTQRFKRWRQKLRRYSGKRSSAGVSFEMNTFGTHPVLGDEQRRYDLDFDYYYHMNVWYTYRLLGFLHDLTFGFGRLRGVVPIDPRLTSQDSPAFAAGFDYGFSKLTFALHDYFSVDAKLILGASSQGFAPGVGGTIRIGNMDETHLELGAEYIGDIGYLLFFELAWDTVPNFMMALRAEVSNYPLANDEALASRGMLKTVWKASRHFHLFVDIGYGRRRSMPNGSVVGRAGALFHF